MPRRNATIESDVDNVMSQALSTQSGSQSQAATQSGSQSQGGSISPLEIRQKAMEVVKYLLLLESRKVPVKRADLNKNVIKDASRHFGAIMAAAKKELSDVFGLHLIEIDCCTKSYLLVSQLNADARSCQHRGDSDLEKIALLLPVLSFAFMNGGSVEETDLWHFLDKLGLNKEEYHPVYGRMERFLRHDMSREGYLDWTKVGGSDASKMSVSWGPRSTREVAKMDCLKFVCEVYSPEGETAVSPEDWHEQYREALEDSRRRNGGERGEGRAVAVEEDEVTR